MKTNGFYHLDSITTRVYNIAADGMKAIAFADHKNIFWAFKSIAKTDK